MKKSEVVDELGALRARIADLQDEARALEDRLKRAGAGTYEGEWYRATVSESIRQSVSWADVAARLNPSRQLVQAYTKATPVVAVRVTARRRDAA